MEPILEPTGTHWNRLVFNEFHSVPLSSTLGSTANSFVFSHSSSSSTISALPPTPLCYRMVWSRATVTPTLTRGDGVMVVIVCMKELGLAGNTGLTPLGDGLLRNRHYRHHRHHPHRNLIGE
ncbi:hypothetical protein LCGC14_1171970 [marine sediment metagenome]|uniref:Uncharacterized protein n=1 Tax=marine sediment metagenome TaxID=412755 RepID=A0A0F9MCH7_9ZZZZ